MSTDLCRFDGCAKPIGNRKLQLCHGHRNQWYRHGKLKPLGKASRPSGTQSKPRGNCAGPGCTNREARAGLCHGHLKQKYTKGELTPLQPKGPAPVTPCHFPGCGRPSAYMDAVLTDKRICRAHYQQRRRGDELTPVGSTRKPAPGRKRQSKPKAPEPKLASNLPAGWHKRTITKPAPPARHEQDARGMIVDFIVPALPDWMPEQARRNLVAMGADDLLDMLGLEAS